MDENYYIKIGEMIKELRLKRNMTKTQLAKGICSVSYITRIENGERCPTSVILRQIANKLSISSDYLFRAIESPTSIEVKNVIDLIFHYYERRDPKKIHKLLIEKKDELNNASIYDKQIIETFKCVCNTFLHNDYEQGLIVIKAILHVTYSEGTTPNDIEFLQQIFYGTFLRKNNQLHEAYNLLINLKNHISNINYFHCNAILPDFYAVLVTVCLQTSRFDECFGYLETGINLCKKHNVHALLRILYGLKGHLYLKLNKEKEAELWFDKALTLNQLICNANDNIDNKALLESLRKFI